MFLAKILPCLVVSLYFSPDSWLDNCESSREFKWNIRKVNKNKSHQLSSLLIVSFYCFFFFNALDIFIDNVDGETSVTWLFYKFFIVTNETNKKRVLVFHKFIILMFLETFFSRKHCANVFMVEQFVCLKSQDDVSFYNIVLKFESMSFSLVICRMYL